MAGGYYGADVAQLRALGARFDRTAEEIERAGRILGQVIATTTQWQGPDAATFRGDWSGAHQPQVVAAAVALRAAADAIRSNADQQQQASSANGTAGAGVAAAIAGAAGAVSSWFSGDGVGVPPVPRGLSAAEAAAWWNSLSAQDRSALLRDEPGALGRMDGLPGSVRDRANRELLVSERSRLLSELSSLPAGDSDRRREIGVALAALRKVETSIQTIEKDGTETAQLLLLDVGSKPPLAAVAVGDVDSADHVAVFTPGIGTTVEGSLDSHVGSMLRLKHRTEDLLFEQGKSGTVATVAWLGYDAPAGVEDLGHIYEASDADFGRSGGVALAAFGEGLRSVNPGCHLTAVGHSYGSYVTGEALQRTDAFDSMAVFGSPGLGTSRAEDLRVDEGQRFVLEARNDLVADAAYFGVDPNHMPGLVNLSTSQSGDLRGVTGHTDYLADRSTSLYNIAAVVGGNSEVAVVGQNVDSVDYVRPLAEPLVAVVKAANVAADAAGAAHDVAVNAASTVHGAVSDGAEAMKKGVEYLWKSR